MPGDPSASLNERAFILQALQSHIRLDGRPLNQYRALNISFGDDPGAADVQLGATRSVYLFASLLKTPNFFFLPSPRMCPTRDLGSIYQ